MKTLDQSYSEPAMNLACDEILLNEVDSEDREATLRFWEPQSPFVVMGYGNNINRECLIESCNQNKIEILRRFSGGGAVLQASGCLNYSLILPISINDGTSNIGSTNCHIMKTHQRAFSEALNDKVTIEGHTDLALKGLKFSGNAQKRTRNALVFHGTFLLNLDLKLLDQSLQMPSAAPSYRKSRSHDKFCKNIPLTVESVKNLIEQAWQTKGASKPVDIEKIHKLTQVKYTQKEWIYRQSKINQ
ncbi:MAG: lipoate--protein ligase family protein [Verrucomicrobiota bacterium]|nr:lipoate--protein ligase family protein [Verrucomicrobiota bacterium]